MNTNLHASILWHMHHSMGLDTSLIRLGTGSTSDYFTWSRGSEYGHADRRGMTFSHQGRHEFFPW